MAVLADTEQQLAWEARQRPRAGYAAIVAGLLMLTSYIWVGVTFKDSPHAGFLESLGQAQKAGPIGDEPSLRTPAFRFYEDHAVSVIGSSLVRAIALVALGWALTFLAAAVRARKPEFPRIAIYVGLFGAILLAIASVLGGWRTLVGVNHFLDGPLTVDASRDIGKDSLLVTADLINQLIGPLSLAAGLFLVSLNAMRVGLLTRFLGVLGIISGVLTVVPQLMPLPVVQAFWLVALGLMLVDKSPAGMPPAWKSGKAEPWPSQRDVAQARRKAAQPQVAEEEGPEPVPAGRAHPSSKKRKRKRRT
jgi:hypothetical protein